jgi:DNA-binding transcriptional LysR family regulator
MNLRSVDLNLLTVLEALLDEAHVTRAADRLGMSQPAVSNALERCRKLFDDPLLVRGPGRMRLTPLAERLQVPLREALASLGALVSPQQPDLRDLHQTVRIVMPDFPANLIVGHVYRELFRVAPGIRLVIRPWLGPSDALDGLARGAVDVVMAASHITGASIRKRELARTNYKVMMRREHPAARVFDLEQWLAYPHVQVSGSGDSDGVVDATLAKCRLDRQIGIVVPTFQMVPPLLATSELIALLPGRSVPQDDQRFVSFDPPLPVEGFPVYIAWHARHDNDVGVQLVAGMLTDALTLHQSRINENG